MATVGVKGLTGQIRRLHLTLKL